MSQNGEWGVLTIQGQMGKSPSKPWMIEHFSSFGPLFPLVSP